MAVQVVKLLLDDFYYSLVDPDVAYCADYLLQHPQQIKRAIPELREIGMDIHATFLEGVLAIIEGRKFRVIQKETGEFFALPGDFPYWARFLAAVEMLREDFTADDNYEALDLLNKVVQDYSRLRALFRRMYKKESEAEKRFRQVWDANREAFERLYKTYKSALQHSALHLYDKILKALYEMY